MPPSGREIEPDTTDRSDTDRVERARIVDVLRSVAATSRRGADDGLSRRAFYRRLERHGLHTPSPIVPDGPVPHRIT